MTDISDILWHLFFKKDYVMKKYIFLDTKKVTLLKICAIECQKYVLPSLRAELLITV